jgi:mannose/fructose/N-acetylgalactosamine-specific phosphotransferase system component IIC
MLNLIRKKPVVLVPIVGVLFLLAQVTASAGSAGSVSAQEQEYSLGFIRAVLIALGYWWTSSAFNGNMGFNVFRWPLMAGPIVGLIMGDMAEGILIGASINLLFIGVISAGGSMPADPGLAGWLGVALAMSAGLGTTEAVAIAAPLGFLGTLGFFARMSVDIGFVQWADARADEGDIDGVSRANWVPSQAFVFVVYFLGALILLLVGNTALNSLFDAIDPFRGGSADWRWIRDGLIVAGTLLVGVGIAINLNLILTRATVPYFLIFFTVAALTGVNLIAVAIVAAGLAVLHIMFTRGGQDVPATSI